MAVNDAGCGEFSEKSKPIKPESSEQRAKRESEARDRAITRLQALIRGRSGRMAGKLQMEHIIEQRRQEAERLQQQKAEEERVAAEEKAKNEAEEGANAKAKAEADAKTQAEAEEAASKTAEEKEKVEAER
jgi:hypothetical protein